MGTEKKHSSAFEKISLNSKRLTLAKKNDIDLHIILHAQEFF